MKQDESKQGKQSVANTGKARHARKDVSEHDQGTPTPRRSTRNRDKVSEKPEEEDKQPTKTGQKRGRGKKEQDNDQDQPPPKSSKPSGTIGSKHDKAAPPAQQASVSRLPKEGTLAHWKAMPGWVDGKVIEILTTDKKVEGKQFRASKDNPKIVLKSNAKSGKICVHNVDNVYFD